jgi:hypothetical protein
MEKGLKLLCKKCAARDGFIGGLAFSGTLAIDDGFQCPVCDGEEEDIGKVLGEEVGKSSIGKDSGGRR